MIKILNCIVCIMIIITLAGCETEAQRSATTGAILGAGAGQLLGRDTQSTMIGAGVGAGVGYMIGNEEDKIRQRRELESIRAESNVETIWITNSNGSQIAIRLIKDGPGYIGPRGERYASRPTQEQLRMIYGF